MNADLGQTLGEMLREERGSKKLSLEQVNRDTKISFGVLKALEQDDFESFESDIYLKGFLKSYAKYLALDETHVIRTLDRQRGGATDKRGAMWDIEESVKEEKLKSPRIFRRFVVPLLFLLIVVLAFLFFNERRKVQDIRSGGSHGAATVDTDTPAV